MELANVSLADSWVRSVETDPSSVCFVLDAVLEADHERFYWPPKPGEVSAYARVRWRLTGEVWWDEGPNLEMSAKDASGELDYGHIDVWLREGDVERLEGDWGSVCVRKAQQDVEYLDG